MDSLIINDWPDLAQAWELELATRRTCEALEALIPKIEHIGDIELLDALSAYLQAVHDFVVTAQRIRDYVRP